MRGFSTSRTAAVTFLLLLCGYRSSPCCVLAKGFLVMAVLHHSLCVCVCVCVCVCEGTSMCRLCPAPCGSPCLCHEVRLPRYTDPADVTSHYRREGAPVSTPEVTRRNYPSRSALQQTATGAVRGSNNTQPIILGLKTTVYVVLIGVK